MRSIGWSKRVPVGVLCSRQDKSAPSDGRNAGFALPVDGGREALTINVLLVDVRFGKPTHCLVDGLQVQHAQRKDRRERGAGPPFRGRHGRSEAAHGR